MELIYLIFSINFIFSLFLANLQTMKYWLSHLPLEVWVDVYRYPWINRRKLARIVHRFCNRKFTEYLQFYLHDWGKQKLNNYLCFDKDGLCKYVDYARHRLHFPQTPMPVNIKSFERISIYHFDAQTMNFLRQIGPILSNVNLELCGDSLDDLGIILANLVPLLNSVHSLAFNMCALLTVKQCFGEEFNKVKVLKICGLGSEDEATVRAQADVLLDWILPAQEDNGPKCCKTVLTNALFEKISPAIRQQFLAAKTPRTFALILSLISSLAWSRFDEFHLPNSIGEEMHGVKMEHGYLRIIQITRHPANRGTEMQEWIKGIEAKKPYGRPNRVEIYRPTIGSLDAPENEEADQQPSTSKKT